MAVAILFACMEQARADPVCMTSQTFATYVRVNSAAADFPKGAAIFDLVAEKPEDIAAAISSSSITVDDMRSSAAVVVDTNVDQAVLAAAYTFVAALAGRWLSIVVDGAAFDVVALSESVLSRPRSRPSNTDKLLSVGFISDDIDHVVLGGTDIPAMNAAMNRIQYAKEVQIAPAPSPVALVATLVTVADLRRRPGLERPGTFVGDTVVELSEFRQLATPLRGSSKPQSELAPALPLTARQERLIAADKLSMEEVLDLLGARRGPEHKQVWHCSRPNRHTNGDRVPSMRIKEGQVRCMRCDGEPLGPVRLTADTLAITVDEAADYLLEHLTK